MFIVLCKHTEKELKIYVIGISHTRFNCVQCHDPILSAAFRSITSNSRIGALNKNSSWIAVTRTILTIKAGASN